MNIVQTASRRNRRHGILLTALALGLCSAITGCSQETIESAAKDTARNAEVVAREAKRAERKARPAVDKLDRGARVTAALRLNKRLPDTIRVDAGADSIRLRGSVRTQEEKDLAGSIAKDAVDNGVTVSNEIELSGKEQ